MKVTTAILESMLTAAKDEIDGGFCAIYAGPVPETAGEALDLDNDHTRLAVLSLDNDGATGLEFDSAVAGLLAKPAAAVWEGTNDFNGAEDSEGELTPTFFRFGTGLLDEEGTEARLQGSVGGPTSAAEMKLEGETLIDNGVNTAVVATFNVRLTPIG